MTQEILQRLRQFQRQAQMLRDLTASLQEHAPQGAEGRDSTGQVRVSIGATVMVNLHGQAVDVTDFPGGHWPASNTSNYSDATVTDGDADWSLAE
jgi:hypothetical protein